MKLEDMVCSPEHAKKLKALEVKQESLFYWRQYDKDSWHLCYKRNLSLPDSNLVSAFTASELGEMLPAEIQSDSASKANMRLEICKNHPNYWCMGYSAPKMAPIFTVIDYNEANARAKILIALIENKLIEVEK